jgi:nucleoredoxin
MRRFFFGLAATIALSAGESGAAAALPNEASSLAAHDAPYQPANAMELALADKLVVLDAGASQAFATARLAGVKFYALYFSAGWCPPCREFTPKLMTAYAELRALYPEFETVMVNFDRSPAAMAAYMRDDQMKWPAIRWDKVRSVKEFAPYAGTSLPRLVVMDENGQVLSDSLRGAEHVVPDVVLADIQEMLRSYRRKNPRPKT